MLPDIYSKHIHLINDNIYNLARVASIGRGRKCVLCFKYDTKDKLRYPYLLTCSFVLMNVMCLETSSGVWNLELALLKILETDPNLPIILLSYLPI